MNGASTEQPLPEFIAPRPGKAGWGWRRMAWLIFLACLIHIGLIVSLGSKKNPVPRTVTNAPQLRLASRADELVQLENPALFALPNPRDFATEVWSKAPETISPSFRWTETPRWLPLNGSHLGAIFSQFMQTNTFAPPLLNFKAAPQFLLPAANILSALPIGSRLQVSQTLATRGLLFQPALPSLPVNDAIAPSHVRVLVDMTGNVLSTILLPSGNSVEAASRSDEADSQALALARSLRFKPAEELNFGEVTFYWHTIPALATNAP
jgi:hypothetical protein